MNILLAEDDECVLKCYTKFLEQKCHNVFAFEDGEDALNFFMQDPQQIDLIISDHSMLCMDGDELFYKVREIIPDLPFVLATGLDETSEIVLKLIDEGAIILTKPIKEEQLLTIVKQMELKDKQLA